MERMNGARSSSGPRALLELGPARKARRARSFAWKPREPQPRGGPRKPCPSAELGEDGLRLWAVGCGCGLCSGSWETWAGP